MKQYALLIDGEPEFTGAESDLKQFIFDTLIQRGEQKMNLMDLEEFNLNLINEAFGEVLDRIPDFINSCLERLRRKGGKDGEFILMMEMGMSRFEFEFGTLGNRDYPYPYTYSLRVVNFRDMPDLDFEDGFHSEKLEKLTKSIQKWLLQLEAEYSITERIVRRPRHGVKPIPPKGFCEE